MPISSRAKRSWCSQKGLAPLPSTSHAYISDPLARGRYLYHGGAIALVTLLYAINWLSLFTALVFTLAPLKLAIITWHHDWYRTCRFEHVARFETYFALSYTALAALTVLPPKLPHA